MMERFRIGPQLFLVLLATVIGVFTGLGAVFFLLLIRLVKSLFFGVLFPAMAPAPFLIFLLPALGGLAIGPLIHYFPREAKGDGVPSAMETIALGGGIIRPMTVALRTVTAALTIGSGGSVGREAPIAQIGAAVGSAVGQFLRVSGERMRNLVGCGAAGGIAAVFNAPMGGVFFALEVLLGDFSMQTFPPIVIASVAAVSVSRAFLGNVLIFRVPQFHLASFPQILICAFLGAACGVIAQLFIRSLDSTEKRFSSSKIPVWRRPAGESPGSSRSSSRRFSEPMTSLSIRLSTAPSPGFSCSGSVWRRSPPPPSLSDRAGREGSWGPRSSSAA